MSNFHQDTTTAALQYTIESGARFISLAFLNEMTTEHIGQRTLYGLLQHLMCMQSKCKLRELQEKKSFM